MPDHPFDSLTPDFILDAIESQGYQCNGRFLALNSNENRVYQIGLEDAQPIIAKFYRPDRWSDEQIMEEHLFVQQLADQEITACPPLADTSHHTLRKINGFRVALFQNLGGRAPEITDSETLTSLGRLLARIHNVGANEPFKERPRISTETHARSSVDYITRHMIPAELAEAYETICSDLIRELDQFQTLLPAINTIRVHGDCHIGNVLSRDEQFHFVDFDDCRTAAAVQDIWMLLSGTDEFQNQQLTAILEGYEQFRDFNYQELQLLEYYRTLRILHYSAWLAKRWHDPAFPMAFPWFNTVRYWEEHILQLREQLSALQQRQVGNLV